MGTSGRSDVRVAVRISQRVWTEEVERLDRRSAARIAAEREQRNLVEQGLSIVDLLRCEEDGPRQTQLGGLFKVYVPITRGPASQRPFGFVLAPRSDDEGVYLVVIAFGERHPRRGTRSVYERAHKRLHGRYQDQ